jgi:hypothetical protein
MLHRVKMDDGVEGTWHGSKMGAKLANGSAILAPTGPQAVEMEYCRFLWTGGLSWYKATHTSF